MTSGFVEHQHREWHFRQPTGSENRGARLQPDVACRENQLRFAEGIALACGGMAQLLGISGNAVKARNQYQ